MAEKKIVNVAVREELADWLEWASKNKSTTATGYINGLIAADMRATRDAATYAARFAAWQNGREGEGEAAKKDRPTRAEGRTLISSGVAELLSSGMTAAQVRMLLEGYADAADSKAGAGR